MGARVNQSGPHNQTGAAPGAAPAHRRGLATRLLNAEGQLWLTLMFTVLGTIVL